MHSKITHLLVPLSVLAVVLSGCSSDGEPEEAELAAGAEAPTSSPGDGTSDSTSGDGDTQAGDSGETDSQTGSAASTAKQRNQVENRAPGNPDAQGRQGDVFDRIPAQTSAKSGSCIAVGDARDVRSGGFVAGAWDEVSSAYGTAQPGKKANQVRLYWIPLHAGSMGGITVTASPDSGGKNVKVVQKSVADADQWKFYDTLITLPKGGSWTFRAQSGQDRGCFTANVG